MEFQGFQELIETMGKYGHDYKQNLIEEQGEDGAFRREEMGELSYHTRKMIYAMLSNNRVWSAIKEKEEQLDKIFKNYDIDALKKANPEDLIAEIRGIKCGNRQIKKQMFALAGNIETLERIARDHGSIEAYLNRPDLENVVKSLSRPDEEYKLKYMGIALVCEYLKNVGVEVIKPDTLLCRLLGRLGYSNKIPSTPWEAISICKEIGRVCNMPQAEVDAILWQYCARDYFECCTETPSCEKCLVSKCKYRDGK